MVHMLLSPTTVLLLHVYLPISCYLTDLEGYVSGIMPFLTYKFSLHKCMQNLEQLSSSSGSEVPLYHTSLLYN
jgi:hypothetical protein